MIHHGLLGKKLVLLTFASKLTELQQRNVFWKSWHPPLACWWLAGGSAFRWMCSLYSDLKLENKFSFTNLFHFFCLIHFLIFFSPKHELSKWTDWVHVYLFWCDTELNPAQSWCQAVPTASAAGGTSVLYRPSGITHSLESLHRPMNTYVRYTACTGSGPQVIVLTRFFILGLGFNRI